MLSSYSGSLRFTVLTGNLMGLGGRLGKDRIIREISGLRFEAAGFQEVRAWLGGLGGNNHRDLAKGLGQGYQGNHAPGSYLLGLGRSGQSSFFAQPLLPAPGREHELSRYRTLKRLLSERRSVLVTRLDVRFRTDSDTTVTLGDYLGFYNVHLTNRGTAERQQELHHLLGLMDRQRQRTRHQLLVGDLNCCPDSPEHRAVTAAGFSDSAAGSTQPTFDRDNTEVQPGDPDPSGRLDYIFLRPGAGQRPGELRILRSQLVLDHRCRGRDGGDYHLSDHYGVAAELEIRDPAR